MADGFSYPSPDNQTVAPQDGINLTPASPVLPSKIIEDRANRTDYALGEDSPGKDTLRAMLSSGREPQIRQMAAAKADSDFRQEKLDNVQKIIDSGAPIDGDTVNKIVSIGTTPEANPDTVLEDKFGKNVAFTAVAGDPSKNLIFQSAFEKIPDKTREGTMIASAVISRKMQAKGVREETEAAYNNLPWFGGQQGQVDKSGSYFKDILSGGIYQYVVQRNLVNSDPINSWLPGSNKLEQIQSLYLLPHDKFKKALMDVAGPGSELFKNAPNEALDFVRAAEQFGTSDAYVENLYGIANIAPIVGPLAVRSVRSIGRLIRGAEVASTAAKTVEEVKGETGLAQSVLDYLKNLPTSEGTQRETTITINGKTTKVDYPTANKWGEKLGFKDKTEKQLQDFITGTKQEVANFEKTIAEDSARQPKETIDHYAKQARVGREGIAAAERELAGRSKPSVAEQTARDILSQSPKPEEKQWYVPTAAIKRPWESQPRVGEMRVENGTPRIFTDDGAEVGLSNTPQEGYTRVHVDEPTGANTVTFRNETVPYEPGSGQLNGKPVVYFTQKEADALSSVLDKEKNYQLLQDDKGRWFVGDRDNGGKKVSRYVTGNTEPERGRIPFHPGEGNDALEVGQRITRVDNGSQQRVRFGNEVVSGVEQDTRRALADVVRSQANEHPQDVLTRIGQPEVAAEVAAGERLAAESQTPIPTQGDVDAIRRNVPTSAQPVPYYNNASGLSWKRVTELIDEFKNGLTATMVERLPQSAWERSRDLARQAVLKYNRISSDAIRDQETHYNWLTNTYAVETKVGKPNGELFDSREQATHWKNLQYRLGTNATVQQEGNKFYLSHFRDFDETQSAVREAILLGNETPRSVVNSILGMAGLRSSAYTVSPFQRTARTTATTAPSRLRTSIDDAADKLKQSSEALSKTERQELADILVHNRDFIPPGGSGKDRGFFYQGQHDFEQAFNSKFGYMPSVQQWDAYQAFKDLNDLDAILRMAGQYRDMTRQGTRMYRFAFTNRDNQNVRTEFLAGKEVPDMYPLTTADANVYVLEDNKFVSKYDLKDGSEYSKFVNDKIKSGEYKIIHVYDPRGKPMQETTGIKADIHFVIARKFDERPVYFGENFDYRPGGHVIYQGQHYLKQPQIGPGENGRLTHFGDVSLKAFETQREADFWGERYNTAREMLRNNDAGLDAYVSANLPETPAEFRKYFADGTFNLEHPFLHTLAGRDTLQSNEKFLASNPQYKGLKDTFTAYNLKQMEDSAFMQDRGVPLQTVMNRGTEANPVWANVDAPLLDPYTSLSKGLSQIVRSRWMSDYKIQAAESWIQEFGHMFDQSKLPLEKLRQNPLYYLYHPDAVDKAFIANNPEAYAAMRIARANILNFIGAKGEVGALMDGFQNKLVDGIANKFGEKAAVVADRTVLPGVRNVPTYMRSATFNMVDGHFNPVQLAQQAFGAIQALAISPMNGMKGLTGSALVRWMKYTEDPAIINRFADIARNMGWNRDHFLEAYSAWKESGVHNIGSEVAMASMLDEPVMFRSAFGRFVDKGRWFFNKGEELNRDVSYFTAYHDWRDENPTRILDNRAKTEIMSRFDTLNTNMTRASNAAYNEGLAAIPSQFWTWNARFAEQMMTFGAGRQLTVAEKARVFAANSMIWGVPSTLGGVTLGLVPYANYDDIKKFMMTKGINLSDKWIEAFNEGLLQTGLHLISGRDVSLHRFTPNADQLRIFSDIQTGKKEWAEFFLGASGSKAIQVLSATKPFLAYTMSAFSKEGDFQITVNDYMAFAKEFSGASNAIKSIYAYNTGRDLSKHGQLQADNLDKFESIALAFGLEPQRVADAWTRKAALNDIKNAQASLEKNILQDADIAFRAAQDGDYQTYDTYMGRVRGWIGMGGFNSHEERKIFQKAIHGRESLIDNVDQEWLRRGPGMDELPKVQKYFDQMNSR